VRRAPFSLFAALIGLVGLSTPVHAGPLSATGKVIAILAGELFVGAAEGHLDGAGTLAIRSQADPALTCLGQFTSSAALGGSGQLQCSDGITATFRFQRLSVFRGHGTGETSRGPMSFAYGMGAKEAEVHLKLPAGKKLMGSGTALALVDL
jgi:hypothetical protein